MNKKVNTGIFLIVGTALSLFIAVALFVLGMLGIQAILGDNPPEIMILLMFFLLLILVFGGTFFLYNRIINFFIKSVLLRYQSKKLGENYAEIFFLCVKKVYKRVPKKG